MEIANNINTQTFKSRFMSSKATIEVNKLAQEQGINNFIEQVNNSIRYSGNYKFNVKHLYSKALDIVKTEIKYEKNGIKYVVTETSSKIKNPAEFTMSLLKSLSDKTSNFYKKLFG